jgi:hypothetical protein
MANRRVQYDAASKSMVPIAKSFAASSTWTTDNFKDMDKWFDALITDTFL